MDETQECVTIQMKAIEQYFSSDTVHFAVQGGSTQNPIVRPFK